MRLHVVQEEAAELCEQGHRLFSENRVDESVESYSKALDILEPLSDAMDPEVVSRAPLSSPGSARTQRTASYGVS